MSGAPNNLQVYVGEHQKWKAYKTNKLKIQKSSNPNSSFTYKFMIQEWFPCKHEKK